MPARRLYGNNLSTTLASAASSSDTTLTLTDATGFPSPSAGFPSYESSWLTLDDGEGNVEIVLVTARSGNVVTVSRGQQGTTAQTWDAGTTAENRWTADDGVSRIASWYGPSLTDDGEIAIDTNTGIVWYRFSGVTYRLAQAPGAGSTSADALALFDTSNGGVLRGQTAWRLTSNAHLFPTSDAVTFQLPGLPTPDPAATTAARVWWDNAAEELVVANGSALVRIGASATASLQSAYAAGQTIDIDTAPLTFVASSYDFLVDGPENALFGAGDPLDAFQVHADRIEFDAVSSIELACSDVLDFLIAGDWTVDCDGAIGIEAVGDVDIASDDEIRITAASGTTIAGGLDITGTLDVTGDVVAPSFLGSLRMRDTNDTHYAALACGTNLTANRTWTLAWGDAARTMTLAGDFTTAGAVSITTFAGTLLDDANDAAMRTTLGLGALAVLATVGASQIDAAAVTLAKMADLTGPTVVGRDSGTGVPKALTPAELRTVIGDASTTTKGVVELATGGEDAASVAVQGDDWRLRWAQVALYLGA